MSRQQTVLYIFGVFGFMKLFGFIISCICPLTDFRFCI